jgi:phage tail tape-measure protein
MATIRDRYILDIEIQGDSLNRINSQLGRPGGSTGLLGSLGGVARVATAAGTALGGIGAGAVIAQAAQATAAYEDMRDTLTVVTGGIEEADAAYAQLVDFAQTTPFNMQDLTAGFIRLSNAGIEPTNELLTTLGNAASVAEDSAQAFEALTQVISRSAAGGLGVEDLDRLADAGINVYGILQDTLGLTRAQVGEFGKTAEGAREIVAALEEGFNERYGNAMKERLNNISTATSNLGIAANNALIAVGEGGLSGGIVYAAERMTELIGANSDLAESLGSVLGEGIKIAVDAFANIVTAMIEGEGAFGSLKRIIEAVTPVFSALFELFEALEPIVRPIAQLILDVLVKAFEFLASIVTSVIEAITSFVNSLGNIGAPIEAIANGIRTAFEGILNFLEGIMTRIIDTVVGAWEWIADKLWNNSIIPDLLDNITGGFRGMGANILEFFGQLPGEIAGKFVDLTTRVVQNVSDLVGRVAQTVRNAFQGIGDFFRDLFGGGDTDVAETTAELEEALNANINPDKLRETGELLALVQQQLDSLSPIMQNHISLMEGVNEVTPEMTEVVDNLNDALQDSLDIYEDLTRETEKELQHITDLSSQYESWAPRLSAATETLESQISIVERLNSLYPTLTEELSSNFDAVNALPEPIIALTEAHNEARESIQNLERAYSDNNSELGRYNRATQDITTAIRNLVTQIGNAIRDLGTMTSRAQQAEAAANRATAAINQQIERANYANSIRTTTGSANARTGGSGGNLFDLFDGFFAAGGRIGYGKFGIVGEAGPEIVTGPANVIGTDQTAAMLGGGGGPYNVTYNINAVDASSFRNMIARDPEFIHAVVQKGAKRRGL